MRAGIRASGVAAALAALVLAATPAHAQLGGLKKKLKDQISGKPAAAAAAPKTQSSGVSADPTSFYTPANRIVITPAVVDQFLTGLRAEVAERDRIAASKDADANVVRFWRRHDRKIYCDSVAKALEAEQTSAQTAMQRASTEAQMNAAMKRIQDVNAAKNKGCDKGTEPELIQSFFDNLRTAESGLDQTGASAAGLSRGQYAFLRERIAALVLDTARPNYPPVGYTATEMSAIRARSAALKPLLLRDFIASGERAPSSVY